MIVAVILITAAILGIKVRYDNYLTEQFKIDKIYNEVIERLKYQKTQAIPYIGSNQLRDLILLETNLKYKLKLWRSVSRRIEDNACVNFRVIEDRGEIFKVWEWVTV